MADPFVAEIRMFPFNFPPKGWAWCDGQLMALSQNTALFALLGTTYGGNGKNNFALPDLRGRAPMHPGNGPGLSLRDLGEQGGSRDVSLLEFEMPRHRHPLSVSGNPASTGVPGPVVSISRSTGGTAYKSEELNNTTPMSTQAISVAGQGNPHNNMQPYLTVYFAIALQGVFPPRS